MASAVVTVFGFVVVGFLGYWVGALMACEWLYAGATGKWKYTRGGVIVGRIGNPSYGEFASAGRPGSNLCGLVGVFVTGPLGAIAGGVGGWALSRRGRG
ncbi:MAG TPA: hypothetical protein VKA15_16650 [Isosphaeraceae bacterium]|nr:hypothetical protein [Isosphaeraceae bacterium]